MKSLGLEKERQKSDMKHTHTQDIQYKKSRAQCVSSLKRYSRVASEHINMCQSSGRIKISSSLILQTHRMKAHHTITLTPRYKNTRITSQYYTMVTGSVCYVNYHHYSYDRDNCFLSLPKPKAQHINSLHTHHILYTNTPTHTQSTVLLNPHK